MQDGDRTPTKMPWPVHGTPPMAWAPPKADDLVVASIILLSTDLVFPMTRRRYHVRMGDGGTVGERPPVDQKRGGWGAGYAHPPKFFPERVVTHSETA